MLTMVFSIGSSPLPKTQQTTSDKGGFTMGRHSRTPPTLHHLAKEKCLTTTESTFVPSEPNQLLGQRGRARGASQHLQPGRPKGVTSFTTAVAQHSFSLVGTITPGHSGTASLLPSQLTAL